MKLVANSAEADLARLSFDVLCMIWKSRLCVPISLLAGVGAGHPRCFSNWLLSSFWASERIAHFHLRLSLTVGI